MPKLILLSFSLSLLRLGVVFHHKMLTRAMCYIFGILTWCMISGTSDAMVTISPNETDRQALLHFKQGITKDPLGALASWNTSIHFCDWNGVICDNLRLRTTALQLDSQELVGSLSSYIANLSELTDIYLSNNILEGSLPPDIGRLSKLQVLHLNNNSFTGEIPANISACRNLQSLLLGGSHFVGKIPSELGLLGKLQGLDLHTNNLTGVIPPSFSNLSSLINISLALNSLEGSIPSDIGRVSHLRFVNIYGNSISGTVPSSLFNITSLYYLAMAENNLHGSFPANMGNTLPNLEVFGGGLNNFTGFIPASLSNASGLTTLDCADCMLSGPVPPSFGALRRLVWFNFGNNSLQVDDAVGMGFLTSLTNCTYLEVLGLDSNLFSGKLPNTVANLSTNLRMFLFGTNQLSGAFPVGIENYGKLTFLSLENNLFTGRIPLGIGKLQNLQKIFLYGNRFSGQIPSSIGNMTLLTDIKLEDNILSGSIPSELGNCKHLQVLHLSRNKLSGRIPMSIMSLSSLSISLSLARNNLEGSLPSEVGNLRSLGELDLSENMLSGEIPATLGACKSLEHLRLEGNFFQGTIPLALSALSSIQELDLSRNNFSGQIPRFLEKFSYLQYLNLSFNVMEGEVPSEGVFRNTSAFSVQGNRGLCGGISNLKLPPCSNQSSDKKTKHLVIMLATAIPPLIASLLLLLLLPFIHKRHFSKRSDTREDSDAPSLQIVDISVGHIKVTYAELHQATSGFSSSNLIGRGGFGSVYKAFDICNEPIVAVKVFNLARQGASKSFMRECEALKNIRHRNLVKIITSCSSVDFQGNEFMALVYEYMPKGNLEQWLHPMVTDSERLLVNLNIVKRLDISIDVALALEYLHHHCHVPIIHCDLKPSNVLLDDDIIGHVGDFGLARFLTDIPSKVSQDQTPSLGIKGSIGYLPPEYGMGGRASSAGDVYSFGILLLEMFTGKSPTDDIFKDGLTLHQFAKDAFPDRVMEIIDSDLLLQATNNLEGSIICEKLQECLVSVIRIAISCSEKSTKMRMNIIDVATEMHMIKEIFLGAGIYVDQEGELHLKEKCSSVTEK